VGKLLGKYGHFKGAPEAVKVYRLMFDTFQRISPGRMERRRYSRVISASFFSFFLFRERVYSSSRKLAGQGSKVATESAFLTLNA
jgi:hypothetical protein